MDIQQGSYNPILGGTNITQIGGATLTLGQKTSANSIPVVVSSDQSAIPVSGTFYQATQPISGSVTVTQSTGTNLHAVLDANSGVDIGKLTANQSVNVAQMNGVTTSMGSGIMGTGVQRVAIASDNDAITVKQATGTNLHAVLDANSGVDIGKLTANQSINLSQVAGGTAITSGVTGAIAAGGDTANGSSDAGNPLKIGGIGHTANPTAVTDGQRVAATFDKLGKQITVGAIRDLKGVTQTSISNTTSETTIISAVASTFMDLYGLILANTGASTTKVTIKDSTAGTTRAIIEVPTLETRGFMLPVDSAIPQATVNNNWTATCGTATTALEVTALWVKNT